MASFAYEDFGDENDLFAGSSDEPHNNNRDSAKVILVVPTGRGVARNSLRRGTKIFSIYFGNKKSNLLDDRLANSLTISLFLGSDLDLNKQLPSCSVWSA